MPCSALMEPSSSGDDVVDDAVEFLPARQEGVRSAPSGWLRLKWMLPSPTWPKATGRMPGSRSVTAAIALGSELRHRATGTETSCLMLPPSKLLRLDDAFAHQPERVALLGAGGDGRVDDQPGLERLLQQPFERRAHVAASGCAVETSIST